MLSRIRKMYLIIRERLTQFSIISIRSINNIIFVIIIKIMIIKIVKIIIIIIFVHIYMYMDDLIHFLVKMSK